jgi:hypothetical protein
LQAATQTSAQANAEGNTCGGDTLRAVSKSLLRDAATANISLAYYSSEDKRLTENIGKGATVAGFVGIFTPISAAAGAVSGVVAFGSLVGSWF